jgi:hypothetical protein
MFVLRVWEAHLQAREYRHQLDSLESDSAKALEIQNNLNEIEKYNGLWDEFKDVTDITRSGDNGGHFMNRIILDFESTVFERCETVCAVYV